MTTPTSSSTDEPAVATSEQKNLRASSEPHGRSRASIIVAVLVVLFVVAMIASTKFVSPEEAAALRPKQFTAKTFVADNFDKTVQTLTEKATDLGTLAPAVDADEKAAGGQYGVDVGSGKFAFPVSLTGYVTEADKNFLVLDVDGVPKGDTVRIPVGSAVSGTPIRDASGFMTFSDFPGQTDFQNVANELKLKIAADVVGPLDPSSLKGKNVTVVGAFSTGGPANAFLVQPASIEVAP